METPDSVAKAEPTSAACLDCGLPYEQFLIDVLLPRSQWLIIHPDEHGVLCARCIVRRVADKIAGAVACRMVVEVAPRVMTTRGVCVACGQVRRVRKDGGMIAHVCNGVYNQHPQWR